MKIATWNVNSIRVRQERLLAWLAKAAPDVVCLQELKVPERDFPFEPLRQAGYHAAVFGQPTFNGVAILSREEPKDVRLGLDDGVEDPQARLIAATVGDVRVLSAYFPNGETVGSEKWAYKLAWIERLRAHLERHYEPGEPLALCGDFNVAPDDADVANPAEWAETVLCHPDARAAIEALRSWGFVDLVRHYHPGGGLFSWWDYQNLAFPKDDGLRIDHVFVTEPLVGRSNAAGVDREERKGQKPSDHAPVTATFDVAAGKEKRAPDAGRAKKLILVDGHSLAYRAFYGLPLYDQRGKVSFSTAQGEYTNAVYGFANMLIKTWNDEKPDCIAVAFDLGRTFRDDLFAEYKGTRDKMPDELVGQIDRIGQLVKAFDIPAVTAEGYEADDILGTLSRRAAEDGLEVLIVTGDTDAFQLIGPHVRVLAPGRLWSDTSIWDEAAIEARYGLRPAQLIDYKAMVGDTSDNVPGVRGIGEKTAKALLQQYDSIDGIYAHLDEVQPNRAKTALEAGHEMALLSRDLITIRTELPLELAWADCAVHSYDRGKVEAFFDEMEFRSIRNRLPDDGMAQGGRSAATPAPARGAAARGKQMAMFAGDGDTEARALRPEVTKTTIVRDEATLGALAAALKKAPWIAFDTETTATDPLRAQLVGISFAVTPGEGSYIPIGHATDAPQLPLEAVQKALAGILADPARPKVGHNAKYDMAVLHLAGMDVAGVKFDTMLAEFLIEPSNRLGLKALARSRLGVEMTEISELIGTGRKQLTMDQVPIEDAAPYAAADADVTLRLMALQLPLLDEIGLRGLLDEVEVPLIPVLLDMELTGVLVDTKLLGKMSARLAERLAAIEVEVYELVGGPVNLNSPTQLGEVLFGRLGLKAPSGRRTASGQASVAADVLESMRGAHPVIDLVLEHRQLTKIKGTYLDALPRLANPATGRVHTSFNQTGAVSGRLSSTDPNLQNIPIRTELGREVRQAFIVPKGSKLIAADYSQVELRIVAHICDDPGLKAAFAAGEDIHRATAAKVLGVSPDSVTPDQRRFAKVVNFGLLYGMGTQSLAQQAGVSMKEAQNFIDAYFTGFPSVKAYIEETKRKAREEGYVETLFGRRRSFPILATETRDARTNIMQRAAEREAVNHPMQGSAADIIKVAMIRIHDAFRERGLKARLLLQVHDELVLEAPGAEVDEVAQLVRELMEGAYPLDPPLKVEVGIGRNWDEVK